MKQPISYVAFRSQADGAPGLEVRSSEDKERLEKWLSGDLSEIQGSDNDESSPEVDSDEFPAESRKNVFSELLMRAEDSLSSFHPLIQIGPTMIVAVKALYTEREFYPDAIKNFERIYETDTSSIFAIHREKVSVFNRHMRTTNELIGSANIVPDAILLSLVATYDSIFSEMVRLLIRMRPERYKNSDHSITFGELLAMESFEDAINQFVDQEVDKIMAGSHDEQIRYIEKYFKFEIRDSYDEYTEFLEIFERRNIIAHGGTKFTKRYVENAKRFKISIEGVKEGDNAFPNKKYLKRSLDRLLEVILLSIFVAWRNQRPDEIGDAFDSMSSITYNLIKRGRYRLAARILEYCLYKHSTKAPDRTRRMMVVNLANALKKLKNTSRSEEVLENEDWSAVTDDFLICIAAIREEMETVMELMPKVISQESISTLDFKEWPVFDWVREKEEFLDALSKYGKDDAVIAIEMRSK